MDKDQITCAHKVVKDFDSNLTFTSQLFRCLNRSSVYINEKEREAKYLNASLNSAEKQLP